MIVALAGRRIDAPGTTPGRFPPEHADVVARRIRALLVKRGATMLLSSAACGADLLAQRAAAELGLRTMVVLPFCPERFRQTSVSDRPGNWARLFDEVVEHAAATGDLVVLAGGGEPDQAYARVNAVLLDQALALAREGGDVVGRLLAVVVWDGQTHGPADLTASFAHEAAARGIPTIEISTLAAESADPTRLGRTRD